MSFEKTLAEEFKQKNRGVMSVWMKHDLNQDYETPRPKSRIGLSSEAEEYLIRNRGSLVLGDPQGNPGTPRGPRLHGTDAEEVYQRHRGTVGNLMNLQENRGYCSPRPQPRVKDEAWDTATKNKDGCMKLVLNSGENSKYYTPRPNPRVKTEAQDAADRNKGVMDKIMDGPSNQSYETPRLAPRVKPEAEGNALRNSGTMDLILDRSKAPQPSPSPPRVKPEAQENYDRNRGTLTHTYYNYGNFQLSARAVPKIKGEGQEIANVGRNGTCKVLFEKYGSLPVDPRPQPRVKTYDASKIAKKNRGSIGTLLGTKGRR